MKGQITRPRLRDAAVALAALAAVLRVLQEIAEMIVM